MSVDPTPLAFLLTGAVGLAAFLRYDSFEKAHVGRTHVIDELRAGVLVYDEECRMIDHNEWVTSTLGLPADAVGRDVRRVLGDTFDLEGEVGSSPPDAAAVARGLRDREIELGDCEESIHLHVEVTPLEGPRGLSIGYSVVWYDVTAQKHAQRELEASNERPANERDLREEIRNTLITTSSRSDLEQAFCNSAIDEERVLAGGEYIYTVTFNESTDGTYEGALNEATEGALKEAADATGNDGATSQTDSVAVDTTTPTIGAGDFTLTNPSAQNVTVRINSSEALAIINVTISNATTKTLTKSNFRESSSGGTYTYTATFNEGTDGTYEGTLNKVADAAGDDGASDQTDSITVDTTSPTIDIWRRD